MFKNLNLSNRLLLTFAVLVLSTILSSIYTTKSMVNSTGSDQKLSAILTLNELSNSIHTLSSDFKTYLLTKDKIALEKIEKSKVNFNKSINSYIEKSTNEKEKLEIIKELASDLFSMQETYIDQLKDNRGIDTSAINKISVIDQRIQDKLKTILESKISSKENLIGDSAKRDLDLFISFFNIALLILAFYFLRINLISPFFELIKNLEHISNKNYINFYKGNDDWTKSF